MVHRGYMTVSEILTKIRDRRILVVGDIMLDHYIIGDASRISPEAPVPVVAVERENYALGAGANVALNLVSLGGNVELCGTVGSDLAGSRVINMLSGAGIAFDQRFVKNNADTIIKTRVVVRGQQLCRIDREAKRSIYSLKGQDDLEYLESRIKQSDAVILSDYNKGVLDSPNVNLVIGWAKKYKTFIALDPKPSNKLKYSDVDLLTPNKAEAYELAGYKLEPDGEPIEAICESIDKQYRPRYLIVTLGAGGMLLSTHGEVADVMPTYAREVFDVSGAGDTVISALTLALSCGVPVKDAMHFANLAAGVVIGKIGTAVASPDEILAFDKRTC